MNGHNGSFAKYSDLTDEDLDVIINHDTRLRQSDFGGQVKYRIGGADGAEED